MSASGAIFITDGAFSFSRRGGLGYTGRQVIAPGPDTPRRPVSRPQPVRRGKVRGTGLGGLMAALGWVVLALGSLACTVVAAWVVLSLSQAAAQQGTAWTTNRWWFWFIALLVTLVLPFALAAWKHQSDPRRITGTMPWLLVLWNAGGLLLATQIVPDLLARALRSHGDWVAADPLGDVHAATRVMSALGHHAADVIDGGAQTATQQNTVWELGIDAPTDLSQAISVPFTDEGTAILLDVTLEGPSGERVALPYLFDTGASYTTISSETARQLGIDVPEDAPTLTFNTASGPHESRMVYLPALEVGTKRIEGLLVSVCDGCVNERNVGLLGHNVMREFFSQTDYRNQRMLLIPLPEGEDNNRAYDIEPVVDIKLQGSPEVWLDRVHWLVHVHNRSTRTLHDVIPEVRFADGPALRGEPIDSIEPGAIGRSLIRGRAASPKQRSDKRHYSLRVAQAYW